MRKSWWLVGVALAVSSVSADPAKPKPPKKAKATTKSGPTPPKGFWKVLVQPKAKWTVAFFGGEKPIDASDYHPEPITIETYDVRKVGTADVARLRWRQGKDS